MKKEDLNNIALHILRNDGKNNWQKLVNVCNLLSVKLCPIYVSIKNGHKCRFYLNDYYFPDEGIGKTVLESGCNAVEKLLNKYVNISKISSSNKYNVNNHDIRIDVVAEKPKVGSNINRDKRSTQEEVLTKLADLCLSEYTGDLWSILNKYCLLEKIQFDPQFTDLDTEFSCSFLFNKIEFGETVVSNTRVNAGRILAEKFIRKYASNYDKHYDKMEQMLTLVAIECRSVKNNEIIQILTSTCEYLNITLNKCITKSADVYTCQLILNNKKCQVTGVSSSENEAFILAIENFFVKYFSSQDFGKIQNLRIFSQIANFCLTTKFADEWKTICNSCKLLGYKFYERFTEENNSFSMSFFIDGVCSGIVGVGQTRGMAGISLGTQFVKKYNDLKELFIENISQLEDDYFFVFVATLCVDKFWSNNWKILSQFCSKYSINLLKYVQKDDFNQFRCSMFLGIHRYENSVALANQNLAFNLLAEHFFSKFGKRKLSESDTKKLLKEIADSATHRVKQLDGATNENNCSANPLIKMVDAPIININNSTMDNEKIFREIAVFCKSNQKSDDWKTLCNACRSLNHRIYEKFIGCGHKFLCEVYINDVYINYGESLDRKEAARSAAKLFITKYQCENIFKEIAKFSKLNLEKNDWITLTNACKTLNYKFDEKCVSDGRQFVCEISIENIPLNFIGRKSTRREAAVSVAKQFFDKYCCKNDSSELNLCEEGTSQISDKNRISLDIENMFKEIARFCKLNPLKDDWKTLCNACKSLKYRIREKIVCHDNQFVCDIYIENIQISFAKKSPTHLDAAICAAKLFINKYFCTNDSSEFSLCKEDTSQISDNCDEDIKNFQKISQLCRLYEYSDDWKALLNTCNLLDFKFQEKYTKEKNEYICKFYIENKLLNLTGRGSTKLESAKDATRQFMDKYYEHQVVDSNQHAAQHNDQKTLNNITNNSNPEEVLIISKNQTYSGVYFLTY